MIKIEITYKEIIDIPDQAIIEGYCIAKLKKAGIPVIGALIFRGLETGRLTMFNNPEKMSNDYVYQDD